MESLFLELAGVALGSRNCLSHTPSPKEWEIIYSIAEKQSMVGICFAGVEKLQLQEQVPPMDLLMDWLGQTEYIKTINNKVDEQCIVIQNRLKEYGLSVCILKGQGIGSLYDGLSDLRQSGDIDVWVKGGFEVVNEFVQNTKPTMDIAYHRFHYNIFEDTEVELHHRPTLMRNLYDDKVLQRWCDSFDDDSFKQNEKGVIVPPLSFNRVFILTHIYRHFLFEGIGLRQLIDYYYVLKTEVTPKSEIESLRELFASIKLQRFAAGVMWILNDILGLPDANLLCKPNKEEGCFILNEILNTGNFGHGETRYKGYCKLRRMASHGLHLIAHYPSEVIWTPIWLVYHKYWKWARIRKIKKNAAS